MQTVQMPYSICPLKILKSLNLPNQNCSQISNFCSGDQNNHWLYSKVNLSSKWPKTKDKYFIAEIYRKSLRRSRFWLCSAQLVYILDKLYTKYHYNQKAQKGISGTVKQPREDQYFIPMFKLFGCASWVLKLCSLFWVWGSKILVWTSIQLF